MVNFVLIGAAGYIAPQHMKAIKDIGGNLLAVMDPHDSVGILDSYFPNALYFREFERLDRYCERIIHDGNIIDYVSICSPNWLHDVHCGWAMRLGADVICEKPTVLRERNLDRLMMIEERTGNCVWTVLQLRYHPITEKIKNYLDVFKIDNDIVIKYSTPRGNWYDFSWKGTEGMSGGMISNLGIHLLDILGCLFGLPVSFNVIKCQKDVLEFGLIFSRADVVVRLSKSINEKKERLFIVNGCEYSFLNGFDDLHTTVYQNILDGNGVSLQDVRPSIRMADRIRRLLGG